MKNKEVWKDVPGYKGYYQASNLGRIKSLGRFVSGRNGHPRQLKTTILKPRKGKRGYEIIALSKNSTRKMVPVHRIVLMSFKKNPLNKRCVNHKDGNKLNNRLNNLEWATDLENMNHAWDNNLMNPKRGSEVGNSKLNEVDVFKIKALMKTGMTQVRIAKIFNCSDNAISDINVGRTWKHVK